MYCVYLTIYSGKLLPPFYIGSSSVKKVRNGYHGTVNSRRYRTVYRNELKRNPHLFKTNIISLQPTRNAALQRELEIQKKLKVVKSPLYFNESYAKGCFGADTSGKNNGFYGRQHSEETLTKMRKPKSYTRNMVYQKSDSHKANMSKVFSERRWYNDGAKNYSIPDTDPRIKELGLLKGIVNRKNRRASHVLLCPNQ